MISIIIPTYNQDQYLKACIDSALRQSYQDKEIIVINDGSTDSTQDILATYNDITVITTPNRGLSAARNTGIAASRGEWITFLDSDDMLLPGALSYLVAPAVAMDADICIGGQKTAVLLSPRNALRKTLYRTLDGSAWGKIYRRELIINEIFTPGLYYEDLEFLFRVYRKAHRVVTCDHEVYSYRHNPEGISNAFSERRFDLLRVTEMIERVIADSPADLRRSARNRRLAACLHILHLLKKERMQNVYPAIIAKCKSEVRRLRAEAIADPASRTKIRLGALISYLGIYP